MEGPFGIGGRTRRGAESDCLLTLLVDTTAERIRFSYSVGECDVENVRQEIYCHVIGNWKHWKPENCPAGAALRVMVGQGAARAVAKLQRRGDLKIVLATDTAAAEGQDFLSWVPTVGVDGSSDWDPHTHTIEPDLPPSHKKEKPCSTRKTPPNCQQLSMNFGA